MIMRLNSKEIELLKSYNEEYFVYSRYAQKKKPEDEAFLCKNNLKGLKRYELILKMYYYFFWNLKNIFRPPDELEIIDAFKSIP